MTAHLLKTDWRRLWPWIVIGWAGMVAAAIPAWMFDFERFAPGFGGLTMDWSGGSVSIDPPEPAAPWLHCLHSYRHWAIVPPLAISAMLGFGGMNWDGTRPLRRIDFVRSKLLAILLFLVLPQVLVLSLVLVVQGFGTGSMWVMAVRSGGSLLLLHLTSLLFGRLCGGFWPWLAGVAALAAIAGLVQAFHTSDLHRIYSPSMSLRLLPMLAVPFYWWPVAVSALLTTVLLIVFRRRRPLLRIVLGCLAIAGLSPLAEKFRPPVGLYPLHSIADWEGALTFETSAHTIHPGNAYISVKTHGLAADEGVGWKLARGYPLAAHGREIAHFEGADKPMSRGNLVPGQAYGIAGRSIRLPVSPEIPDPEEFNWSGGADQVYLGSFDPDEAAAASGELSLDAELFGVVGRYERVLELEIGDEEAFREAGLQARARLAASPYPVMTLDILSAPTRIGAVALDPLMGMRVLLHLPAEGRTVEMRRWGPRQDWLLGEIKVERRSFPMFSPSFAQYPGQDMELQLPPMPDLTDAKVMIFLPRILGKVRTRVQADGIRVGQSGKRKFEVVHVAPPGPSNDGINCAVPMPDPEACTIDEAGYWINHVVLYHSDGDWAVPALAPFVARFPEIFLDYPIDEQNWRQPIGELLIAWLPESKKDLVINAYAERPRDSLLRVIRARGWLDQVRAPLLDAFRANPHPDSGVIASICQFEDPETYPALIEALRRAYSPQGYYSVRQLPGIGLQLDRAMLEIGRELAAESPGKWDRNLRRRLIAPAAHGVREAFERIWTMSGRSPEYPDWPPDWHDLASVVVLPPEVGHDRERQTAFFENLSPDDFNYDPLARTWRLEPSTP